MTVTTITENGSSGRALVAGLESVRPLASTLPSLLQEDDFCVRLTSAFDEVLAPVLATLDCFGSYIAPRIAPQDFVDWLAGWVGVEVDETWPLERRRDLVAEAIEVYQRRGTQAGLARHIELYAGVSPSIEDSGGCAWSQEAGGDLPGSPRPRLVVRLELDEPSHVDASVLNRIAHFSRPAHVPHEVFLIIKSELVPVETDVEDVPEPDAPPPVHPPEASVVEIGPGTPADPEDPEAPDITPELLEEKEEEEVEAEMPTSISDSPEIGSATTEHGETRGDELADFDHSGTDAGTDEGMDVTDNADPELGGSGSSEPDGDESGQIP